jgi:hypothetical protein
MRRFQLLGNFGMSLYVFKRPRKNVCYIIPYNF